MTRPEAKHTHVLLMITVVMLLGSYLINWNENNANSDPRQFEPHWWREQLHFSLQYLKILSYFGAVVMSQVLCWSLKSKKIPLSSKAFISSALLYQTCWCWFPNLLTLPIIFCHFAFKQSSLCQWKSSKMFVLGISEIICCIAKKSNSLLSQEDVGMGWLFYGFKENNSLFFKIVCN